MRISLCARWRFLLSVMEGPVPPWGQNAPWLNRKSHVTWRATHTHTHTLCGGLHGRAAAFAIISESISRGWWGFGGKNNMMWKKKDVGMDGQMNELQQTNTNPGMAVRILERTPFLFFCERASTAGRTIWSRRHIANALLNRCLFMWPQTYSMCPALSIPSDFVCSEEK